MALHGYRPCYWYHQIRWKPMSGEGPWITAILNYDGSDELRLRINVEGGKEEEMRTDGRLQEAITETKNRVERRCRRDGVTAKMQVTVSYHETETSMDTADWEQAHLERDSSGESEMSEAEDQGTDLRSWIRPGEIQKHHRAADPVEKGPEASSQRLTPRGRGTGEKQSKGKKRVDLSIFIVQTSFVDGTIHDLRPYLKKGKETHEHFDPVWISATEYLEQRERELDESGATLIRSFGPMLYTDYPRPPVPSLLTDGTSWLDVVGLAKRYISPAVIDVEALTEPTKYPYLRRGVFSVDGLPTLWEEFCSMVNYRVMYGLYEFVVMSFGLCNAPGTFQDAMNEIFHDYLDKFIVVYLNDILIFSRIVEEHAEHLKIVLGLLRQHQYKVNLDKCEFGRTKILYLGHEISADGLRPEDAKVASIRDWPRPQTVTEGDFIHPRVVKEARLPTTGSPTPISVTLGDDKTQSFFDQTVTDLPFFLTLEPTDRSPVFHRHHSSAHFDVMETGYDFILGTPWSCRFRSTEADWVTNTLVLKTKCGQTYRVPFIGTTATPRPDPPPPEPSVPTPSPSITVTSPWQFAHFIRQDDVTFFMVDVTDLLHYDPPCPDAELIPLEPDPPSISMAPISTSVPPPSVESTPPSRADVDAEKLARYTADLEPVVRDLIREYRDVFPSSFSYAGIPPMRDVEHSIQLVPDYRVHHQAPYRLSIPKATELKRQLEELLRLGFMKPSNSPWGAPTITVSTATRLRTTIPCLVPMSCSTA
ncbi:hypothetical protein CBR_g30998 [Chara braunii]|uniref:Reverse transcriptase domain-containing protein n=1 Tax=Chara braunii TaxID=69332 RepID=A0A388LE43_CHABU|nr:hypothetical protein CBR_g30998 [Chara braunii]|eukprot:GBG80537.1 hypothetical protein CBR_g30998 [Chara braunii]